MTLNNKLLLDDNLIDQQHDQLFDSLRRITALDDQRLNEEKVVDQLTRLNQQIHQHFLSEEALMKRVSMPADELAAHQAEHLRILEELTQIHLNIMQGKLLRVSDVVEQISHWISTHIVDFDLAIRAYIAKAAPK